MKEDRVDITDEIATWHVRDIIRLLDFLEKNGYIKTYFDGYDASIYLIRQRKNENNVCE